MERHHAARVLFQLRNRVHAIAHHPRLKLHAHQFGVEFLHQPVVDHLAIGNRELDVVVVESRRPPGFLNLLGGSIEILPRASPLGQRRIAQPKRS